MKKYYVLVLGIMVMLTGCMNLEYFTRQGDYENALVYCKNIKSESQQRDCYFDLAGEFMKIGDYETALECYKSSSDPAFGKRKVGAKLIVRDDFNRGVRLIENGSANMPDVRKDLFYEAASKIRDSAVYQIRHNNSTLAAERFVQAAICYTKSDQYEAGVRSYLKAAKIYLIEIKDDMPKEDDKSFLTQSEKYRDNYYVSSQSSSENLSYRAKINECLRNAVAVKKKNGDSRTTEEIRSNLAFRMLNIEFD